MQITEVRVIVTCPGRNYVLIKVLTDEPGLYGVGDATLNGRELAVATHLAAGVPVFEARNTDSDSGMTPSSLTDRISWTSSTASISPLVTRAGS